MRDLKSDSKVDNRADGISKAAKASSLEVEEADAIVQNDRNLVHLLVDSTIEKQNPQGFEFLLADKEFSNKASIGNTVKFFNGFAADLGLLDKAFFSHEGAKNHFKERLRVFSEYLDEHLLSIKPIIEQAKLLRKGKLVDNWEKLLRETAYHAFFVHYGAKRRGEFDEDGNLRDYVYHVVRTSINCLVRKLRFIDIQSLLVGVLHDTKEDFNEGIVAVLNADEEELDAFLLREKKQGGIDDVLSKDKRGMLDRNSDLVVEELGKFEDYLDRSLMEGGHEQTISVGEAVDMLTKRGGNRMRETVRLLNNLLLKSDIKEILAVISVLLIKFGGDRLDNMKSTRSEKILGETLMVFYLFFQKLRMKLLLNQMKDYFYFDDIGHRQKLSTGWLDTYHSADEETLPESFIDDFVGRLEVEMSGQDLKYGRDFSIDLIPVGHRHSMRTKKDVKRFNVPEGQKDFRHYLVFVPGKNTDLDVVKMKQAAAKVFCEIFDEDEKLLVQKKYRSAFEDVLGGVIKSKREQVGVDEKNYSDVYGVGVWSVYDSVEDFIDSFGGDFYMAFFEDSFKAKSEIHSFVKAYSGDIGRLENMYSFFEELKKGQSVEEILSSTKYGALRVLDDNCPLNIPDADLVALGDRLLPMMTLSLFARREKAVRVFLGKEDLGVVNVPFEAGNSYNENTHVMAWAAPNLIGVKGLSFTEFERGAERCVRITIPEDPTFSPTSHKNRLKVIEDFVKKEKSRIFKGVRKE
ncbi:hypothetical protein CVV38_00670 [Candidatus Peregrinibacteria bacterium HGW-Peregrinibacteria-1]|jgi:hypothetical protein|nr:MAG: hypothetical protein CVV38_00670 [Candidatus Peregrinibacteria bacterium HGW-Peregrinibacteria-1]